jgi:hypothetical protein
VVISEPDAFHPGRSDPDSTPRRGDKFRPMSFGGKNFLKREDQKNMKKRIEGKGKVNRLK